MSAIEIRPALSPREKRLFLSFPWGIYRHDPLWVPPLLPERTKAIDPDQGPFFKDGRAEFFLAWADGRPAGTLCLAEDYNFTRARGAPECMLNHIEFQRDYTVFEALMDFALDWARRHEMKSLYGPYYLDREDCRGLLVEGYERPPAIMCGHQPPYYREFYERYGFVKDGEDLLAYAINFDPDAPEIRRLYRLAERVRRRNPEFTVRGANIADVDGEIDRIVDLQNRALGHFANHVPFTRRDIEAMILPVLDAVDPDLVLFAEVDGKPAGFFPGVPNFNELLIHLNGIRYPWDKLRYLRYRNLRPGCVAIKSVVVPPEYWDIGVAVLLFEQMARRAIAKGYRWADLSLTGEDNPDTWPIAHHMGAQIYKRYRFYRKNVE